jgi:hypothetical protein
VLLRQFFTFFVQLLLFVFHSLQGKSVPCFAYVTVTPTLAPTKQQQQQQQQDTVADAAAENPSSQQLFQLYIYTDMRLVGAALTLSLTHTHPLSLFPQFPFLFLYHSISLVYILSISLVYIISVIHFFF